MTSYPLPTAENISAWLGGRCKNYNGDPSLVGGVALGATLNVCTVGRPVNPRGNAHSAVMSQSINTDHSMSNPSLVRPSLMSHDTNWWGWGCSSVARVSDRHAADAGSIPRCGKGFFSRGQLSVQTLLRCPYIPVYNRMH